MILGDRIELDPRMEAILAEPSSLLEASAGRSMAPQLGEFAEQVAAWGDRLSIQVVVPASESVAFQQRAGKAAPGEPGPADQLEALAVRVLAAFPAKGIVPGTEFDHITIEKAASSILGERIGGNASLRETKLEPNGRLDIWVTLNGLPDRVEIKKAKEVNGHPVPEPWEEIERDYIASARIQPENKLLTTTFRYPYRAALEADTEYLLTDHRLAEPGDYGVDDQGVDFLARERARVESRLKLTGSLKVAPETGTSIALSAELAELFEPDQVKKLSFSVEGGEQTLAGDGELAIPLDSGAGGGFGFALDAFARANARELQDALYGNLVRPPIEAQRTRFELGLTWSRDSLTYHDRFEAEDPFIIHRPSPRLLSKIEAGLRYLDVNLSGDPTALTGLDQGAAVGPYLKGDAIVVFLDPVERTGGLWRLDWENDFDLSGGAEVLGGDDDFVRVKLTTGLRTWHHLGKIPSYFRHRWTGAWASDGTPTYAYFDAGAPDFVRGLEEDEYIGRQFVGGQNELGVNLFEVWNRLTNQQGSAADNTQTSQLRNLYGALFADIGWLSQRVQDGQPIAGAKYLVGYGVLLGINNWSLRERPADFSFGYAYSPQSERNTTGMVFAQINYRF